MCMCDMWHVLCACLTRVGPEGLRSISQEAQSLHTSGEETRSALIDFNDTEMTDSEIIRGRVRSDLSFKC